MSEGHWKTDVGSEGEIPNDILVMVSEAGGGGQTRRGAVAAAQTQPARLHIVVQWVIRGE